MPNLYKARNCANCSKLFIPSGPKNAWCSMLCRLICSCDHSKGENSCWKWQLALDKAGYGYLKLPHRSNPSFAHREMYKAAYQCELVPEQVIRHYCDNPACINPNHLLIGTQIENVQDMWDRKRQQSYENAAKGEKQGNATVSDITALQIFQTTGTENELAEKFGVTPGVVGRIKRGKNWRHVTGASLRVGRPKGEQNTKSKLTTDQVMDIATSKKKGWELAEQYGITNAAVSAIRRGRTWQHVTGIIFRPTNRPRRITTLLTPS